MTIIIIQIIGWQHVELPSIKIRVENSYLIDASKNTWLKDVLLCLDHVIESLINFEKRVLLPLLGKFIQSFMFTIFNNSCIWLNIISKKISPLLEKECFLRFIWEPHYLFWTCIYSTFETSIAYFPSLEIQENLQKGNYIIEVIIKDISQKVLWNNRASLIKLPINI